MKKQACMLILLLLPCLVFGVYNDLIQQGNAAFKAKNWFEAVKLYNKAYMEQPSEQLKKYINLSSQNAYKEAIAKGNVAYKAGNMEEALQWYGQAQIVLPNKKLESFINKIKLQSGPDIIMGGSVVKKDENTPWKWVLIGSDVVLSGLTVALIMDYNKAADSYNGLHDKYDNTTDANYEMLVIEKKKTEDKQAAVAIAGAAAGIIIAYTIVDAFVLHTIFPKDVSIGIKSQKNQFELTLNKEF